MMFTSSFEKIAIINQLADKAVKGVGNAIGGLAGASAAVTKRQIESISGGVRAAKKGFSGSYSKGSRGWNKKQLGGYLAKHRGDEAPKKVEEARKAIVARSERMGKAKPGFAMKYPFITGLGAYGIGHALFSESKEEPQPQVYANR